jgi:hypothetical protein
MPDEQREITATNPRALLAGAQSYIQVDGWNLDTGGPPFSRSSPAALQLRAAARWRTTSTHTAATITMPITTVCQ